MIVLLMMAGSSVGAEADRSLFPELEVGQRVYDLTGSSLTARQIKLVDEQIGVLQGLGATVVAVVRALDATPEETLHQVEALQQAWVAEIGANQDNAIAILINRDPDNPNSARAGIFVGRTFNHGNVPSIEQIGIVENALIPPLRDGNVYGSLVATLSRLETSISSGPPHRRAAGLGCPGCVALTTSAVTGSRVGRVRADVTAAILACGTENQPWKSEK